jgi:hypothetical protein
MSNAITLEPRTQAAAVPPTDDNLLLANAGNMKPEQARGNTTHFVGVPDADKPGGFAGQVGVQFNANDGTTTAYGLWGENVRLPRGATRQDIAEADYSRTQLYPLGGAAQHNGGWGHVELLKQALTELRTGRLDAAEVNRVEHWLRGTIDTAYGADKADWKAPALENFHALTGQFSRAQDAIEDQGEAVIEQLSEALSLSNPTTRSELNNALAQADSLHERFGTLWNDDTQQRFAELGVQAEQRLQASRPGTETSIDTDAQSRSMEVPHPKFVDAQGKPYDPVTTSADGRQWLSADEFAHYLRNSGTPATSGWLIANNPNNVQVLGGQYQFEVGDTVRVPQGKGDPLPGARGAEAAAPGTTVRMLPGTAAYVFGASYPAGAVFLLLPTDQPLANVSSGTLFVSGTGLIKSVAETMKIPGVEGVLKAAAALGPNAVMSVNLGTGEVEVGAGGTMATPGKEALAFWNTRAEVAELDKGFTLPNRGTYSANGGVLTSVNVISGHVMQAVGGKLAGAGEPRLRALGGLLVGLGQGSKDLSRKASYGLWAGVGGRVDVTLNGDGPLTVTGPKGNQLLGPDTSKLTPGSLNFGDDFLAKQNILDHMYSGTRVWEVGQKELTRAGELGKPAKTYDIPALQLAYRVNDLLRKGGMLGPGEYVTSTADARWRLERLHNSYIQRATNGEGDLDPRRAQWLGRASELVGALVNNSGVNFGWEVLAEANRSAFTPQQTDSRAAETQWFFNPQGEFTPRRTLPMHEGDFMDTANLPR